MKLKKIASLMLAGIMAVSMLAGCKGNTISENPGSSSSEPTVANVVSAVEGGIKRHNPNLTITVKSSPTLDQRIEKLFATATDYKDNEDVIVEHLKDVFGITDNGFKIDNSDFMNPDTAAYIADHGSNGKDSDDNSLWGYAYIKVTNDKDAFVTAGNVIGKAFADAGFSNKIAEIGSTDELKGYAVNYTLYVCGDETVTFNGDTNSYVVAVLKASYSDTTL